MMPELDCAPSAAEALEGADAVVLVTEWPEFLALDWKAVAATMAGDVVIDGRNALDARRRCAPPACVYEGIGIG